MARLGPIKPADICARRRAHRGQRPGVAAPLALVHVYVIDAGRLDLYKHLSHAGLGGGEVDNLEDLGSSVTAELDCAHHPAPSAWT
jgi:hypothetical protein